MLHRASLCILLLSASVAALAADDSAREAQADEATATIELPSKETAEYWVIRSQALTELIPFMTQKRAEFKETHRLMAQYLDSIGKGEDFIRSGAKAPDDPEIYAEALGIADEIKASGVKLPKKPLTWDQLVEIAMQHELHVGYMPTHVSDAEELAMIRKVCQQKQTYGQKVRRDLGDVVKKCMNIWVYLGTIDRQGDCKVYLYREREKERLAKEEQMRQRREARAAMGHEVRAQREYERERMKNEQMWENRRRRMDRRYYGYRW